MAKQVKKSQTQQRVEELEDLRAVITTGAGFRVFKRLINFTGPLRMNFSTDHAIHAFGDGQRNVGNKIVTDVLEASPEIAVRLLVETSINPKQEEIKNDVHKTDETDPAADN